MSTHFHIFVSQIDKLRDTYTQHVYGDIHTCMCVHDVGVRVRND